MLFHPITLTLLIVADYSRPSSAALPDVQIATRQTDPAPPWPSQSFKSANFTPPALSISWRGPTEQGLLFFALLGLPHTTAAPLIMSDDGQLVWHGTHPNFSKRSSWVPGAKTWQR